MSAHASQAFIIAHCTDSEDLPKTEWNQTENRFSGTATALLRTQGISAPDSSALVLGTGAEVP